MRKRSVTIEADDFEEYLQKSKEALVKSDKVKGRFVHPRPKKNHNQNMNVTSHPNLVVRSMPLPDILEEAFEQEFDAEALLRDYDNLMNSKEIVSSLGFLDDAPALLIKERKESSLTSLDDFAGGQSIGDYSCNLVV